MRSKPGPSSFVRPIHALALAAWTSTAVVLAGACGGSSSSLGGADASTDHGSSGSGGGSGSSSGGSSGSSSGGGSGSGSGSSSGAIDSGSGSGSGGGGDGGTPETCAAAAGAHTYLGCDFWPTVTANNAWSIFDFAVVVANAGNTIANITVTGPGNTNQTAMVAPGGQLKIYLPWVSALKGVDTDSCGTAKPLAASVLAPASAYHLVSSVPVAVFQFNALEYQGTGGPAGKDWSSCPGSQVCASSSTAIGCYSFSNDASLLLPSTSMSGNYRVTGHQGWASVSMGGYVAVTATADGTTVNFKVSSAGQIIAGSGVAATAAGGTLTLVMNHGDVAELLGGPTDASDLSGSLIQASAPVQVITGLPCLDVPDTAPACDHVEESNWPVETLGSDYVVAQPTSPSGSAVGQLVRIYGNFDGTTLTYSPSTPAGCPATINAGQVAECGIVAQDFEVKGSSSFAVGLFTQGASIVDPTAVSPDQQGDPDQSLAIPVAQFRTRYVFLAPDDYEESYAVITMPTGTAVSIDSQPVTSAPSPIGSSGYAVLRATLSSALGGSHILTATAPVGLQVMGYGSYTSYQYPAGLDLSFIAPVPTK